MGKWKMILAEVFAGAAFCLLLLMVFTFFLEENWQSGSFLMCSVLLLCLSWLFLKDSVKRDMAIAELEKKVYKMGEICSAFADIVEKVERHDTHLSNLKARISNLEEKNVTGPSAEAEEKPRKELIQEENKKRRVWEGTGAVTCLRAEDKGFKLYEEETATGSVRKQSIGDTQKAVVKVPVYLPGEKQLPNRQYDKAKERVKLEQVRTDGPNTLIKEYIIYKDGRGTFWLNKDGEITPVDFREGDRLTKGMTDLIGASNMRGLFEIPRGDLVNKEVTRISPAVISLKNNKGTDTEEGVLSTIGKIEIR